jgi:hypothetical protein
MIYLLSAVSLIFLSNAIAVILTHGMDVGRYFDLMVICNRLGEAASSCKSNAESVGLVICAGAMLVALVLVSWPRRTPVFNQSEGDSSLAFIAVGSLILLIAGYSLLVKASAPLATYRDETFKTAGTVVSIGNLVWPVCLQLSNCAGSMRWRVAFLVLVLPIVVFSPFRGVLLAIVIFGIVVPTIEVALTRLREGRIGFSHVAKLGVIASLLVAALALQILLESKDRPSNLNLTGMSTVSQLSSKLSQRIAIPLFQAHLAYEESLAPDLPSIGDEVAAKFRLSRSLNLNQFLYAKTHEGAVFGETTSQFYGEGSLRGSGLPFTWTAAASLALVLIWATLRRLGFESGTLVGIALWRGSLGGVVTVLPGLVLQLIMCFLASRLTHLTKGKGHRP